MSFLFTGNKEPSQLLTVPTRFIYWFRNDLRIADNEAFWNAVRDADEILPVYVFDPRKYRVKDLGFRKTGIKRALQVIGAVNKLRQELRNRGGDLIIRIGEPEMVVYELANNYNVQEIRASKEITLEETNIEASLSKKLKGINVDISLTWMNTLTHPHDLPFYISLLPGSYAEFSQAVTGIPVRPPVVESPVRAFFQPENPGLLPQMPDLGFQPDELVSVDPDSEEKTEKDISERVKSGEADITEIENWISGGRLSPRGAYQLVQGLPMAEAVYQRLLRRDYLQYLGLKWGTRLFKPSGIIHNIDQTWVEDTEKFLSWTEARTGDPAVDSFMNELNHTGMISEEGFKVLARYLVQELGVNWTWGAAWFESQLKYYDTVIVWGSWNYLSGVGLETASTI